MGVVSRHRILIFPIFVRKYYKRDKNLTTLLAWFLCSVRKIQIFSFCKFYGSTEYLVSPNFVRKYDKSDKNLTTLLGVVNCNILINSLKINHGIQGIINIFANEVRLVIYRSGYRGVAVQLLEHLDRNLISRDIPKRMP